VLTNVNPPFPKVEQGVIQVGLQGLIHHLQDMHIVTLKVEGDTEFQKWLNVKQNL
jgi:hypothetical protein